MRSDDPTLRVSPWTVIAVALVALIAALWLGWGFRYPPTAAVVGDEVEKEGAPRPPAARQLE